MSMTERKGWQIESRSYQADAIAGVQSAGEPFPRWRVLHA